MPSQPMSNTSRNQIAALYLKDGQLTTSLPGICVYRFDRGFISKIDLDHRFDVLIGKDNYPGQLIASISRSLDIGLKKTFALLLEFLFGS